MTGSAPDEASAAKDAANSSDGGVRATSAAGRKTIGSVANDAIREGLTNEQALERVLAEFPYARTTKATIGKYRRMLRSKGEEVPTAAQARAEAVFRQTSPRPYGEPDGRRSSARPPRPPKRKTVGSVAMDAIREGKTTKQVIEVVKAQFPPGPHIAVRGQLLPQPPASPGRGGPDGAGGDRRRQARFRFACCRPGRSQGRRAP